MTTIPIAQLSLSQLQAAFLALLPRIVTHAGVVFRGERCRASRDDRIAETVAVAWGWFVRLAARGKDPRAFPSVLAGYAARAVQSGRRACGQLSAKDAGNECTQWRQGFRVERLPTLTRQAFARVHGSAGQRAMDAFEERLQHNTQTPVDQQVAFRCDFPAWLQTQSERDRRLIQAMAANERTTTLAGKFGLSPARVSQLRRHFHTDWEQFTSHPADRAPRRPGVGRGADLP